MLPGKNKNPELSFRVLVRRKEYLRAKRLAALGCALKWRLRMRICKNPDTLLGIGISGTA